VASRSSGWMRKAGEFTAARGLTPRTLLIAAAAWLVALVAVGITVRANVAYPLRLRMIDLDVYRNGGLSVLRAGRLYALRSRDGLLFTYPPLAAVLAVPLAVVTFHQAMLLWIPMVYIPLAVVIWIAFRPLLARAGGYALAVFAGLFLVCAYLMPLRQEIRFGQIDIFLVALCVLDLTITRPGWPRGVLIGLATAIKLVPGVFIIYLLVTGRRKAAAVAAASFAVVSGLAWLVEPKASKLYWTSVIFDSRRLGPNEQAANQSLRGMLLRIFHPSAMPVAVWLVVVAIVAVAGFAAARAVHRRGNEMGGIAITGMLAALLSPVAWIHHISWIVVALGVIVGDGRNPRRIVAALATVALFLTSMPIWAKHIFLAHEAPVLVVRFLEDTFGLAALAMIVIIYKTKTTGADIGVLPETGPAGSAPAAEPEVLSASRDG
jgi:alpha-1,2-mannosyltransferase